MAKNSVIYLTQSVGLSVDYEQSLIRLQFVVRDAKEKREKNRVNSWLCGHFFLAVFFRVTHAHVGLSKRATKPFRAHFVYFWRKITVTVNLFSCQCYRAKNLSVTCYRVTLIQTHILPPKLITLFSHLLLQNALDIQKRLLPRQI